MVWLVGQYIAVSLAPSRVPQGVLVWSVMTSQPGGSDGSFCAFNKGSHTAFRHCSPASRNGCWRPASSW